MALAAWWLEVRLADVLVVEVREASNRGSEPLWTAVGRHRISPTPPELAELWDAMWEVIDAAYQFDARFEERLHALANPLNNSLSSLRTKVERDA